MPNTHPPEKKSTLRYYHLFCALFVLLIALPALLVLLGATGIAPETQPQIKAPDPQLRALLEPRYYLAWGQYLNDRLAQIEIVHKGKRWLDYRLFKMTDASDLYVGRHGWLFARHDIDKWRQGVCERPAQIQQLVFELQTIARLLQASGRRFIFCVIPAKSTIYPEFVGALPRNQTCKKSPYDLIVQAQTQGILDCFVRLDDILMAAKKPDQPIFAKTGLALNSHGASIAAQALLQKLSNTSGKIGLDTGHPPSASKAKDRIKLESSDHAPSRVSEAVIYGGQSMNELLPWLTPSFHRLDAIAADIIPSPNHDENISAYDTLLMAVDEDQLTKLRLDVDGWCRMLSIESLASAENRIPLETFTAGMHLALKMEAKQLAVKSLGADAFFAPPSVPGSDGPTLRILSLDISAPNADRLTWSIAQDPSLSGAKPLRTGATRIYLPLPAHPVIDIRINPGQSTGMFFVTAAKLLEFSNGPTMPASRQAIQHGLGAAHPMPTVSAAMQEDRPLAIALNDFEERCIFQRMGNEADIVISGTYAGQPQAIEARVLRHDSREPITAWSIIDSTPANGVFMGILAKVPQGGWYRLAIRCVDQPQINAMGNARWGVGMLVGCIGQSNMKELFFAGNDLVPHDLLALHREGRWHTMDQMGNGATALGNRLIERLGVPVGLLDYAVNGSGLCKVADWGAGYWTDRSNGSIYNKFVKGVAATKGALEYVIWMQGEADAARGTITRNQYQNALMAFAEQQLRHDIVNGSTQPNLPLLITGMIKRPGGKDEPHQAVHDALNAITRQLSDCYLAAVTLDLTNLGRQHLAPEAYTLLGLRLAQTILVLTEKESYYRGPSVAGAERVDATTIDAHLIHRGGFDFSPSTDISGWQALSIGQTIPITATWHHDPQTVRLQLAQPVQGPITLRYLYGALPDAERAIHDNSDLQLPLEPAQVEIE